MIHLKKNFVPISLPGICDVDELMKTLVYSQQYDQRAANCLEEDVRLFTTMWSRCRSSPFIAQCQFFGLFGYRPSTSSKLASPWNSSAAHELLLRNSKNPSSRRPIILPRSNCVIVGISIFSVEETHLGLTKCWLLTNNH